MQTALRVLTAVCERKNPDPKDVEELQRSVPQSDLPADELACKVINVCVEQHKKYHPPRSAYSPARNVRTRPEGVQDH